jgi:hypothetical protein
METPKSFITKFMEDTVRKYPALMAVYEHDLFDNSHYVEFFPASTHEKYEQLMEEEVEAMLTFEDLFPAHSLLTFSGADLLNVTKPIVTRKGNMYELLKYNLTDLDIFKQYQADNIQGSFTMKIPKSAEVISSLPAFNNSKKYGGVLASGKYEMALAA